MQTCISAIDNATKTIFQPCTITRNNTAEWKKHIQTISTKIDELFSQHNIHEDTFIKHADHRVKNIKFTKSIKTFCNAANRYFTLIKNACFMAHQFSRCKYCHDNKKNSCLCNVVIDISNKNFKHDKSTFCPEAKPKSTNRNWYETICDCNAIHAKTNLIHISCQTVRNNNLDKIIELLQIG